MVHPFASMIGFIVFQSKGVVVVIAAAETYQLLAENPLGELSFATPAISGGRMYLRTHTQLISVGGKDEEKTP